MVGLPERDRGHGRPTTARETGCDIGLASRRQSDAGLAPLRQSDGARRRASPPPDDASELWDLDRFATVVDAVEIDGFASTDGVRGTPDP